MSKKANESILSRPPNLLEKRQDIIHSKDELEFGLMGVIKILSKRKGKSGYFIQEFEALFASELQEEVLAERTYIDHENLKIIIKLPDPENAREKELIRHEIVKDYTLGVDELKTRAGLIVMESMDSKTKSLIIDKEKSENN